MRGLVTVPNPVLTQEGRRLDLNNADDVALIESLVKDLRKGMKLWKGAGLTACQIGVPVDLFAINTNSFPEAKKLSIFINTSFVGRGDKVIFEEGCLSIPGKKFAVERFESIYAQTYTIKGKLKLKRFTGWAAACIQQEYDHVHGILLSERGKEIIDG